MWTLTVGRTPIHDNDRNLAGYHDRLEVANIIFYRSGWGHLEDMNAKAVLHWHGQPVLECTKWDIVNWKKQEGVE